MNKKEQNLIRDLAKQYMEIADDPEQERKRDLWRRHQSFKGDRPLVFVRKFAFKELPQSKTECEDPTARSIEYQFRREIFRNTLRDDYIFEPWYTVRSIFTCTGWGVEVKREHSSTDRGSYKIDYPIKKPEDIDKLREPVHEIDEKKTALKKELYEDLIGDIIAIDIDRSPWYRGFSGDLSTHLGHMRGIEHFMMDMFDNPDWLKQFVSFMAEGVGKTHQEAENNGDWGLTSHENQSLTYAEELEDPALNTRGKKRKDLWVYMAAQEFTGVSPDMHEEFLLAYQRPIMEKFGLAAYGCCEDLTMKIDMLRSIKNLRRIGIAPVADVKKSAEQIGPDYILSYRPSPTDMVGYGFREERIRKILGEDLSACRANGCHTDITLKDTETVEGDPDRVRKWVALTREIIDSIF